MIKFSLKGQQLNFGAGGVTSEGSLGIEEVGAVKSGDVLDEAMKVSSDEAWDKVMNMLGDGFEEDDM